MSSISQNSLTVLNRNHRSIPAGTCLISELAQDLLRFPEMLLNTTVVLPTQRLQLYLTRELLTQSGKVGALLPRIVTWDSFLEMMLFTFYDEKLVMGSSQLELLMESAISLAAKKLPYVRRLHANTGHAHELIHFYSDIMRSGAYNGGQEALKEILERQWHRTPAALETLNERIDDVFRVLSEFDRILESKEWTTRPRQRVEAITQFTQSLNSHHQLDTKTYFDSERVIVAGLTSLPKIEQRLLGSLSQFKGFEVWLDEPPPRLSDAPIITLRRAVGLTTTNAPDTSWAQNVRSITSAADITHEALHALDMADMFIAEGVPPHEIAIIVPDENTFGPAFVAAKEFFAAQVSKSIETPITINLPLASSWETSTAGTWLRLARNAALSGELSAMGQYLLHPVTQKLFNATRPDLNRLQQKLKDFPDSMNPSSPDILAFLTQNFSNEFVRYIIDAWSWCLGLDQIPCDTAEHQAKKILSVVEVASLGDLEKNQRERESWRAVIDAVNQVKQLDPVMEYGKADWSKFISDVYRFCAAGSLRDTGEPLSGLQVLGLTEARYVPLSHAIIVGCVEGSFPHGLPVDSLIDNSLRQSIGLPSWSELEALEDTTFHLLTCRIPNVHLSYSLLDVDTPLIRSRWVERLESRIKPIASDTKKLERWLGCFANDPDTKALADLSPNEGQIQGLGRIVSTASASRLRSLLSCPYRYLLESRGVQPIELPEDRQQLKIGQLLHKILEMFFAPKDMDGLDLKLSLRHCPASEHAFVPWATARLEAITQRLVPKDLRMSEDFQQMLGKGWSDVASFWGKLLTGGFALNNVQTELAIGKERASRIEIGGRQIDTRGSIDAVHPGGSYAILVDYKTSSVPLRKQITSGLEPQLPLYSALFSLGQVDKPPGKNIEPKNLAAVYFNLREGKATFAAVGSDIKPLLQSIGLLGKASRPDDMEEVIHTVQGRWLERLNAIDESLRFVADPSNCDYCPYDGICRKDDPRFRSAISKQARPD